MDNESNQAGKAFATALVKVQATLGGARKVAFNPMHKKSYADLASVWDACREPLTANGFAVVQEVSFDSPCVKVTTRLMHASGEQLASTLSMPAGVMEKGGALGDRVTPQSIGSAITYARRYALAAMVGVAPVEDDDDGERAMGRGGDGYDQTRQSYQEPRREEPRQYTSTVVQPPKTQGDPALLAILKSAASKEIRPGDMGMANTWWEAQYDALAKLSSDERKALEGHIAGICQAADRTQPAAAPSNGNGAARREMRL
jgi:hypothetical protein